MWMHSMLAVWFSEQRKAFIHASSFSSRSSRVVCLFISSVVYQPYVADMS